MHIRSIGIVCVVAYAMSACARDGGPGPTAAVQTAPQAPIRVILQLHNSTVAFNSAAFLQQLQSKTAAQAHYLASVSNDTHVYSFTPSAGQTYAQIVEQLRSMPVVAQVSLDQKIPTQ